MQIKSGASLNGLKDEMRPALIAANAIWQEYGKELVVTSGTDGCHSAGSLHYYGYALDFRTNYFNDEQKKTVGEKLKRVLSEFHQNFVVAIEDTHIHVQFKTNEMWHAQQAITKLINKNL